MTLLRFAVITALGLQFDYFLCNTLHVAKYNSAADFLIFLPMMTVLQWLFVFSK